MLFIAFDPADVLSSVTGNAGSMTSVQAPPLPSSTHPNATPGAPYGPTRSPDPRALSPASDQCIENLSYVQYGAGTGASTLFPQEASLVHFENPMYSPANPHAQSIAAAPATSGSSDLDTVDPGAAAHFPFTSEGDRSLGADAVEAADDEGGDNAADGAGISFPGRRKLVVPTRGSPPPSAAEQEGGRKGHSRRRQRGRDLLDVLNECVEEDGLLDAATIAAVQQAAATLGLGGSSSSSSSDIGEGGSGRSSVAALGNEEKSEAAATGYASENSSLQAENGSMDEWWVDEERGGDNKDAPVQVLPVFPISTRQQGVGVFADAFESPPMATRSSMDNNQGRRRVSFADEQRHTPLAVSGRLPCSSTKQLLASQPTRSAMKISTTGNNNYTKIGASTYNTAFQCMHFNSAAGLRSMHGHTQEHGVAIDAAASVQPGTRSTASKAEKCGFAQVGYRAIDSTTLYPGLVGSAYLKAAPMGLSTMPAVDEEGNGDDQDAEGLAQERRMLLQVG